MKLITTGTQRPFDRLVQAVDGLASEGLLGTEVLLQTLPGSYVPRHLELVSFLERTQMAHLAANAELIIGHAGMGTILLALGHQAPLIVMPRKAALGEAVNDHQVRTADHFFRRGILSVVQTRDELADCLAQFPRRMNVAAPEPDKAIMDHLQMFLQEHYRA